MLYTKEYVVIIDYINLPSEIKTELEKRAFRNNTMLEYQSELTYLDDEDKKEGKDLTHCITWDNIESYYSDQCSNNNFKGSITDFISSYGLKVDAWLIKENIDLKGVHRILFNICW
jgi:uncharacterized protein YeeX (DUF496 family)